MTEKKEVKKPRQKQMKLKHVEKQFKDVNKLSTFTIDPEQNLVVKYNEKFDEDKIDALLQEAYENYVHAEDNDLIFFEEHDKFIKYILFLVAVRFSHFDSEVPHTLEEQIPIFNQFVSTGLFRVFHEDILDGAEVSKVLERLDKMNHLMERIAKLEVEHKEQIVKQVKNPELFGIKGGKDATVQESE